MTQSCSQNSVEGFHCKMFGFVGDTHTGYLQEEKRDIYSEDCPFDTGFFLPSFSLSGWKPHAPLAMSSSTASALTPGYSVPSLTGCVMLGKSGDCSDTFLHWKVEMTSEAICMLFTGL